MLFNNFSVPVLLNGVGGFNQLKENQDTQEDVLKANAFVQRETTYFKENIGSISSAEEFVNDTRILRYGLAAYGLEEELFKTAFIQQILESDLTNPESAANRVTDPRWRSFTTAFVKAETTVPGPLQEGFKDVQIGKVYLNELAAFKTDSELETIKQQSETFRTKMGSITRAEDLVKVENRDVLNFIKQAFGVENEATTNSEIVNYLTSPSIPGAAPEGWQDARSVLSFHDETVFNISETDVTPSTPKIIEKVIRLRFENELADEMGFTEYEARGETVRATLRGYTSSSDVDTLIADRTTLNYVKQAFNLSNDPADDATIKSYLTAASQNDVPAAWQPVRAMLNFYPMTVDSLVEDRDTFNELRNRYGVPAIDSNRNGIDDLDLETIRSYLTSTSDDGVPAGWIQMRDFLNLNDADPTPYIAVNFSESTQIVDKHEQNTIRVGSNIEKFKSLKKEADYFSLNIDLTDSNTTLVANTRLLRFAMKSEGISTTTIDSPKMLDALNNDYDFNPNFNSDRLLRQFQSRFSFSTASNTLKTFDETLGETIEDAFVEQSFFTAVGNSDPDLRLAFYFEKRIQELASINNIDEVGWLQILGEQPMLTAFQTAFGLPNTIGKIDIDEQVEIYSRRAESVLGSSNISRFSDQEYRDNFLNLFLSRSTTNNLFGGFNSSSSAIALTLLGNL